MTVNGAEQLVLDLYYSSLRCIQSDQPTQIGQFDRRYDPRACRPFDGPEQRYREVACHRSWTELEIDHPMLAWPTPTCGTPKCLNLAHLDWQSPRSIDYPRGVCVYCGLSADTKDHLLPRTWTGNAVRRHVIVVPACMECNNTISDRYVPAVNERRSLAHKFIRKKNSGILKMPRWSLAELDQLGRTLRSTVERGLHDKKVTQARLAWPEDPNYDLRAMQKSGIENPYALGLLTEALRHLKTTTEGVL